MRTLRAKILLPVVLLAAGPATAGCLAVAAGAGAAAAIAYTERGARSLLDAPVPEVVERARAVFDEMGIEVIVPDDDALENDVTLAGRRGEEEIRVEIEREAENTSEVHVTVRDGPVQWNREAARDILRRIIIHR